MEDTLQPPEDLTRTGFEENLRAARGKKARGAAKAKAGSLTFGELQDKH